MITLLSTCDLACAEVFLLSPWPTFLFSSEVTGAILAPRGSRFSLPVGRVSSQRSIIEKLNDDSFFFFLILSTNSSFVPVVSLYQGPSTTFLGDCTAMAVGVSELCHVIIHMTSALPSLGPVPCLPAGELLGYPGSWLTVLKFPL